MDYERIHKPSPHGGGGISPSKLRAMLLGVERKRREEEELEALSVLRSDPDDPRRSADHCRDVDVVSSIDMAAAAGGHRTKGRVDEDSPDSESGVSSVFEFQRTDRAPHRAVVVTPPFSKPAPSKWDDAQKWIASPTSNRVGKPGAAVAKKTGLAGLGFRQPITKISAEAAAEEFDTKRIDPSQAKKEAGPEKTVNSMSDNRPTVDSGAKPASLVEYSVADSSSIPSLHNSYTAAHSATAVITPPSTVKPVSMRDMGTEMTPIASQEPSRTGTPVRATTPTRSLSSSRSATPKRTAPNLTSIESADFHDGSYQKKLSEKELQMKTRREIMVLGTQLGKTNIAAWASKEVEKSDDFGPLKSVPDQPAKSVIETRAEAWEEAEKAKYLARFKQEEVKIQAWENHQKAKTEAEIRKIEVEVEKTRARAHDRLMNKLAAARHKAEEKRAAAEANRNQQAAKTAQQAEYIRRTGRVPSSFSCWSCCH